MRVNLLTGGTNPELDREQLRADCSSCVGLCCVALAFTRSADFAFDKHAGDECVHLTGDFACGIHPQLRESGMKGCTVFDCLGAGQRVTTAFAEAGGSGADWRSRQDKGAEMFASFPLVRQLHELLWYLTEARELVLATSIAGTGTGAEAESEADASGAGAGTGEGAGEGAGTGAGGGTGTGAGTGRGASPGTGTWTSLRIECDSAILATDALAARLAAPGDTTQRTSQSAAQLTSEAVAEHHLVVVDLLVRVSSQVRDGGAAIHAENPTGRRNTDIARADLVGADLVGADLARADLLGARLAGRDLSRATLRGSYLIGADLSRARLERTDLIGADMRDARLHGADLSRALFVTQPQINSALGNAETHLPANLLRPSHWAD